jgi:hypothetical protein
LWGCGIWGLDIGDGIGVGGGLGRARTNVSDMFTDLCGFVAGRAWLER